MHLCKRAYITRLCDLPLHFKSKVYNNSTVALFHVCKSSRQGPGRWLFYCVCLYSVIKPGFMLDSMKQCGKTFCYYDRSKWRGYMEIHPPCLFLFQQTLLSLFRLRFLDAFLMTKSFIEVFVYPFSSYSLRALSKFFVYVSISYSLGYLFNFFVYVSFNYQELR